MNIDSMSSSISRLCFFAALVILVLAVWQKLANMAGYTLTFVPVDPSRLLSYAGLMVMIVMALLLREIREALTKR